MADTIINVGTATADPITVVVQLEPAAPSDDHIADLSMLFGLVIAACVVVWGAKQVLNLFSVNPTAD